MRRGAAGPLAHGVNDLVRHDRVRRLGCNPSPLLRCLLWKQERHASASQVLESRFGFSSFRPGQERVVEALLAGRSALAVFPTGAGKSLCYQLPALMLDGVTVVVSPLIALMKDQIDALVLQGVDAARLDSSIEQAEARDVSDRLRAGRLKLLYVAPERFNNERFLAQLARRRSRCSRSTRPTASRSGVTTSGRTTSSWRRGRASSAPSACWRSRRPPPQPSWPTSAPASASRPRRPS